MNQLRATRPRLKVKNYLQHGEQAAIAAITPTEDFYNVQKGFPESIDAAGWKLRIDGLVHKPVELTLADIQKLPAVERVMTMECVENRIGGYLIGNGRWKGVAFAPLLAEAGLSGRAKTTRVCRKEPLLCGAPLQRRLADARTVV